MNIRSVLYLSCAISVTLLLGTSVQAADEGSLTTAEFPDIIKFDFERVQQNYEQVGANVGQVTPLIDETLARGEDAVKAGEAARADPTDDNKRTFVSSVMKFVRGAGDSKAKISGLWEEVRGVQSKMGILYTQGQSQTTTRVEELRKEFVREELKYKELVAGNKERRRAEKLGDWELRKLFDDEKRQAQYLNRISDRIAFQEDFLKALGKATDESNGDFALYDQFFGEAVQSFADISDLGTNLPLAVERLQISSTLAKNIPNRKAAAQGFEKIEQTKRIAQQLASQLMDVCGGDLTPTTAGEERVIVKHTESYKRWLEGDNVEYRKPAKTAK